MAKSKTDGSKLKRLLAAREGVQRIEWYYHSRNASLLIAFEGSKLHFTLKTCLELNNKAKFRKRTEEVNEVPAKCEKEACDELRKC